MSERVAMLRGASVHRIHWKLGTDVLVGVCHCGAEHESEDPVQLWDWLLAHPVGHQAVPAPPVRVPVSANA
ncbi:hypothetical protein JOF56_006373 [Kibdelosporangium banguiense]|uniref:Uncharacterized protein n=1 Tax=Kibdelosporangium banguiense TaxID=1365924 RepID=A0ABS4TPY3_9PSEU|nr:hypothetical protein [Kibdelosporangium banguiense]MBP2325988.1 hypothetical protein [Kibdelosporangium banguiense]